MRAVIQRVKKANVTIDDKIKGKIKKGIMLLLAIGQEDTEKDTKYMLEKTMNLRIFEDENEKMNLSLLDIKGEMLVISQFTLYGDCRKGRRPNFMKSAKPETAEEIYNEFIKKAKGYGIKIQTGEFGANMDIDLINDGPVTILIDSKKEF